jgi:hypothetical protein
MAEEKDTLMKSKAASTPKNTPRKKAESKAAKTPESKSKQPSKSASATKRTTSSPKDKTKAPGKTALAEEDARAGSEDPDVDDIPTVNPEAPRHDGEWYWLLKAEPESRFENGVDVRFSIDDLRAKTKPEGWDGKPRYSSHGHGVYQGANGAPVGIRAYSGNTTMNTFISLTIFELSLTVL